MQRLVFFILAFLVFVHIVACLWVLAANMYQDDDQITWMDGESGGKTYKDLGVSE